MEILIGAVVGIFATLLMDVSAVFAIRRKIINLEGLQIVPALLGRWVLSMPQYGRFAYEDVRDLPRQNQEARMGMLLHYLIGIFLGVIFLYILKFTEEDFLNRILTGAAYGVLTNVFPWLVMYPAMGFGFFGRHLAIRKQLMLFSFSNHLMYGLALGVVAHFLLHKIL